MSYLTQTVGRFCLLLSCPLFINADVIYDFVHGGNDPFFPPDHVVWDLPTFETSGYVTNFLYVNGVSADGFPILDAYFNLLPSIIPPFPPNPRGLPSNYLGACGNPNGACMDINYANPNSEGTGYGLPIIRPGRLYGYPDTTLRVTETPEPASFFCACAGLLLVLAAKCRLAPRSRQRF